MDYYKLDAKTKKPVYRLVTKKNYQKYIQDFQETSQSASQELSFEAKSKWFLKCVSQNLKLMPLQQVTTIHSSEFRI